jgi:hypothetical protein
MGGEDTSYTQTYMSNTRQQIKEPVLFLPATPALRRGAHGTTMNDGARCLVFNDIHDQRLYGLRLYDELLAYDLYGGGTWLAGAPTQGVSLGSRYGGNAGVGGGWDSDCFTRHGVCVVLRLRYGLVLDGGRGLGVNHRRKLGLNVKILQKETCQHYVLEI